MNDMYGKGILKGLSVSLKRFVETYLDDLSWIGRRYRTEKGIAHRASKDARGIFTVQYPEEKIPVPEEFRFIPFLVYNEGPNGEKNLLLHILRHLRQGLPAAVHLDRPFDRPGHRPAHPGPGRILHRCRYLHELRPVRRILPV